MILRELLEASEPALAQVVAMLRAAEDMTDAAKSRMQKDMSQTLASLENKAEQALSLAAGITSDLVTQAEAIRGRRPGVGKRSAARSRSAAPAPSDVAPVPKRPPSSNRGVKSTDATIKTIATSPDIRASKAKKKVVSDAI